VGSWDVVSAARRAAGRSGVAPRACVRVYARVLVRCDKDHRSAITCGKLSYSIAHSWRVQARACAWQHNTRCAITSGRLCLFGFARPDGGYDSGGHEQRNCGALSSIAGVSTRACVRGHHTRCAITSGRLGLFGFARPDGGQGSGGHEQRNCGALECTRFSQGVARKGDHNHKHVEGHPPVIQETNKRWVVGWPLHDTAITNFLWCMAYTRGVGGAS